MFSFQFGGNERRVLEALGRSIAVIEFTPDGAIVEANGKFCDLLGYRAGELVGKHHRILVVG